MLPFQCKYTKNTELMAKGNFGLFAANGKPKTEVCYLWSVNDKRQSTFAVSEKCPSMSKKALVITFHLFILVNQPSPCS